MTEIHSPPGPDARAASFQWGQNVFNTVITQKSEPCKDQTHNSPALPALSPFWKKRRGVQRPEQAARSSDTESDSVTRGPTMWNNLHHTHTFRLWKTWVVFNGNLLCFFQVLLSSQIVFGLVLVNGQPVTMASGVLNWKAFTEHPLLTSFFSRDSLFICSLCHSFLMFFIWDLEITSHLWRGKQTGSDFQTSVFERKLLHKIKFYEVLGLPYLIFFLWIYVNGRKGFFSNCHQSLGEGRKRTFLYHHAVFKIKITPDSRGNFHHLEHYQELRRKHEDPTSQRSMPIEGTAERTKTVLKVDILSWTILAMSFYTVYSSPY